MLEEDSGRAAESSLKAYFHPGAYTGANFEKYANPGTDVFTAEDGSIPSSNREIALDSLVSKDSSRRW